MVRHRLRPLTNHHSPVSWIASREPIEVRASRIPAGLNRQAAVRGGQQIRNPKHQIRNKFKIQNSKQTSLVLCFEFRASNLFRISSFGFRFLFLVISGSLWRAVVRVLFATPGANAPRLSASSWGEQFQKMDCAAPASFTHTHTDIRGMHPPSRQARELAEGQKNAGG